MQGLSPLWRHAPGEQLVDAVDWMRGDALEYMPEVAVRIDAIESASADETVEARSGLAARIRAGEEVVSPSEYKRPA